MISHYHWFFELLLWIPPTLIAISWRETVKAWVCHYRGDPTIQSVGGTSFGFKNLDPIGSALAPVLLIIGRTTVYGWANPTEIRPNFLNRGNVDAALAVSAGLLTNFVMAVVWSKASIFATSLAKSSPELSESLLVISQAGIQINVMLIAVHLFPLPPLDMSYIVRGYLPRYPKAWYTYLDPVGQPVVLLLFLFKIAPFYVNPVAKVILSQVQWVSSMF